MAELCLGTVQFGMKYGINNILGQPVEDDVFDMLDAAIEDGIHVIDTASAYGTAEMVLGKYLKSNKRKDCLQIISKLRPNVISDGEKDVSGRIRRECEDTLHRLNISCLDGYLLHTPGYIYNSEILDGMRKLKEQNLIRHAGISIYDLKEGYAALSAGGMDYIQLPYSILDQRGVQKGFIQKAKQSGMTVFTRSAFLQGLFMMDREKIPAGLRHVIPYLEKFDRILERHGAGKAEALIHFAASEADIDYVVFGVDTKEQLQQDIDAYHNKKITSECIAEIKDTFVSIEKSIIFPSLWAQQKAGADTCR
ncbi:MAG: aldo/keto reductase [Eubacterium sp.]|nr:aldo/keto reductase [Eubacterium sp.]